MEFKPGESDSFLVFEKTDALFSKNTTLIFIAGPTGVGKSLFASKLAVRLGGQIVGADAFQLYRDLPILTAQPSQEIERLTPHHLIGVMPLSYQSDAVSYRVLALEAIERIKKQGDLPIITGGSGLYLRALIHPLDPLPKANQELRASLALLSKEELLAQLGKLDPQALSFLDLKNRRRLERALEIILQSGTPLSKLRTNNRKSESSFYGFFLLREREELYERIERNVEKMFEEGVIDEVRKLDTRQLGQTASMALGLREIEAHLRGELSLRATIDLIVHSTKRYAKRQITWFKNQHHFLPWNLSQFSSMEEALDQAILLLSKKLGEECKRRVGRLFPSMSA